MKRQLLPVTLAATAMALAACQSSRDLENRALQGHVESVSVSIQTERAPAGFRSALAESVKSWTDHCAEGEQPLHIEVYVTSFGSTDGVAAFFTGNTQSVRGAVKVYDGADTMLRDVDFYGSQEQAGGIAGLLLNDDDASQLASNVGHAICRDIF